MSILFGILTGVLWAGPKGQIWSLHAEASLQLQPGTQVQIPSSADVQLPHVSWNPRFPRTVVLWDAPGSAGLASAAPVLLPAQLLRGEGRGSTGRDVVRQQWGNAWGGVQSGGSLPQLAVQLGRSWWRGYRCADTLHSTGISQVILYSFAVWKEHNHRRKRQRECLSQIYVLVNSNAYS